MAPACSVLAPPSAGKVDPQLLFSTEVLFTPEPLRNIRLCDDDRIRVINTLVRLVHGGSSLGRTQSIAMPSHTVSDFIEPSHHVKGRKSQRNADTKDEWVWEKDKRGNDILVRVHNVPRRRKFVPDECNDCPCNSDYLTDGRTAKVTLSDGKTRICDDEWRFAGNIEITNDRNEHWTGRSIFRVFIRMMGGCGPSSMMS